jgi:small subunit ribosomal protein S8
MTYVTDPIGDLLTRMRNAQAVRSAECRAPWSRTKEELLTLLKKGGWIMDWRSEGEGVHRDIIVQFSQDHPPLTVKRISKPGRRVYTGYGDLKAVLQGYGIAIITTSQGLMTDIDARKRKIGGEVLCTIS